MPKNLLRDKPMKTRFCGNDLDWIQQALSIEGAEYSAWSRRVLVEAARRTVLAHERNQ